MSNETQAIKPAKNWQLVLFSMQSIANNLPHIFILVFFLIYHTNVNGLAAAVMGIMMTAARMFDGITDPIVGLVFEKLNPKYGKARIFIIVGNIILNICWVLMFLNITSVSNLFKLVWVFVFYVLYIIGYTIMGVGFRAGWNIITKDPKQRSTIPIIQQFVSMPVIIMIGGFTPKLLGMMGGFFDANSWVKLIIGYAIISFVCALLTALSLSSTDKPESYKNLDLKTKKYKFKDYAHVIKQSKPLRMLVVAFSTNKLAQTITTAMSMYLYLYVIQDMEIRGIVSMATIPFTLIFAVLGGMLSRKVGLKKSLVIGSWVCIAAGIVAFVIFPMMPLGKGLITASPVILMSAVIMLATVQTDAMVSDVTDDYKWRTGDHVPGMVGTTFSFVDKMVSSVGTTLVGFLLAALGIKAGIEATPTIYWGILGFFLFAPILGHLASIWAMKYYDIDKEHMKKVQDALAQDKMADAEA